MTCHLLESSMPPQPSHIRHLAGYLQPSTQAVVLAQGPRPDGLLREIRGKCLSRLECLLTDNCIVSNRLRDTHSPKLFDR